tara:strand:+ start:110 stop:490 length:381 start_codon:yes stop_codon:yes gene_type:complete
MKKIKLSVAALSLALSMNAQTTPCDEVTFTRYEVIEMLATIGDILEWQNQDIEEAEYNNQEPSCGKHSEGWGSNHWLTLLEEELYNKLNNKKELNTEKECCKKTAQKVYEYEGLIVVDCENCDEID